MFKTALIDGRWQILFHETFAPQFGPGGPSLAQIVSLLQQQADACAQTAEEVEAGKYASLEGAMATFKARKDQAERSLRTAK